MEFFSIRSNFCFLVRCLMRYSSDEASDLDEKSVDRMRETGLLDLV